MQRQLGDQQFSATTLVAEGINEEFKSRVNGLEQYAKERTDSSMLGNADKRFIHPIFLCSTWHERVTS